MERTLVLMGTDLERFDAWFFGEALAVEDAYFELANEGKTYPVITGWEKQPHEHFWEFCFTFATKERVAEVETDLLNRALGLLKFRQESGAETGPEDLNAEFRDHSAVADQLAASEVWCAAAGERRPGLPRWLHRATDEKGRLREAVIPCWVTASDHTIGQVRVKFWRADKAASFDTLIERMREHFTVLDDAPRAPVAQDDQAPADVASGGGRPGVKAHARARERLRNGEGEAMVKADWKKEYEDETGTAPKDMPSGETQLWKNVKKGVKTRR